ncbi:hypothetical protein [Sphingomonas jatrophae]|uniref:Pectate lyase n=1 Tax=Sphingomonas jatrophae TaxID=1166337 RepID=A0A1I6MC06_9SPHN|nr:hypothetical protein [Sphingomonas jatrophae]SFS13108.1 Pectate lyase [Sphingomonas jatrophae]
MTGQLAFVGAVGYGAETVGGRGGQVVHVTTLADSGAGSLRWALEGVQGPRTVVFDVGGTITLKTQILVEQGNVTIAGQTAPGEGITLEGSRIRVKADEVIVRGIHFRPGDGAVGMDPSDRDGLMIGTTDFEVNNVIVDHNSFSWATDTNLDINGRVNGITVSSNIIAEGLQNSLHAKGAHSKGMTVSNWGGAAGDDRNITIVGNLFSDNAQRNPEIRAGQNVEVVNNYIYNYGLGHAAISVGGGNNGTLLTDIAIVNNVITAGPSTSAANKAGIRSNPVNVENMAVDSRIAIAGNVLTAESGGSFAQDQATVWSYYSASGPQAKVTGSAALNSLTSILATRDVAASVLANAGAVNGAGRDAIDRRIVDEAARGTGGIIDSPAQLATKVARTLTVGATDSDRDGMPDWFEDLYGFAKLTADDKGDRDRDGFTNLEEYINGLITGFDLGSPKLGPVVNGAKGLVIQMPGGAGPVDVTGFVPGGTAKLDLTAALATFKGDTRPLADRVEIAYANGSSYISIDADGAGAGTAKALIAVIESAHVTLADLKGPGATVASAPAIVAAPAPAAAVKVAAPAPLPSAFADTLVAATPTAALPALKASAAADTYTIRSSAQATAETATGGVDQVVAYADYRLGAFVENGSLKGNATQLSGNDLDNKLTGNELANRLFGHDGADQLRGMAGNDLVVGGAGNDRLEGNEGDDTLVGGTGADSLFGGAGRDHFVFFSGDSGFTGTATNDVINDFELGDTLSLDGLTLDFSAIPFFDQGFKTFAPALDFAKGLIAAGEDMVAVGGARDVWLFTDSNADHVIDGAITLMYAGLNDALFHGGMLG